MTDLRTKARALDALAAGIVPMFYDFGYTPDTEDSEQLQQLRKVLQGRLDWVTPELALCAAADALGLPEGHRVLSADVADEWVAAKDGMEYRGGFIGKHIRSLDPTKESLDRLSRATTALLAHLRPTTPPVEREGEK